MRAYKLTFLRNPDFSFISTRGGIEIQKVQEQVNMFKTNPALVGNEKTVNDLLKVLEREFIKIQADGRGNRKWES